MEPLKPDIQIKINQQNNTEIDLTRLKRHQNSLLGLNEVNGANLLETNVMSSYPITRSSSPAKKMKMNGATKGRVFDILKVFHSILLVPNF